MTNWYSYTDGIRQQKTNKKPKTKEKHGIVRHYGDTSGQYGIVGHYGMYQDKAV